MNGQRNYGLNLSMQISLDTLLDDRKMERLRSEGLVFLAAPVGFFDLGQEKVCERWRRLKGMGFRIDTCHPPFGGGNQRYSLCAEDEAIRADAVETYQRYLHAFGWAQVRAVPIHTGGAMHPTAGAKALDRLTDSLSRILPVARDSGVILALENTFYSNPCPFSDAKSPSGVQEAFLNDDCAMLRDYVENWQDPLIRVCHDVGHSVLYGRRLEEDLECLWRLTALYHAHDNDGVSDLHWNIGRGRFPWPTLRKHFCEHPYAEPIFDEVLNDPDEEVRKSLQDAERIVRLYREAVAALNGGC